MTTTRPFCSFSVAMSADTARRGEGDNAADETPLSLLGGRLAPSAGRGLGNGDVDDRLGLRALDVPYAEISRRPEGVCLTGEGGDGSMVRPTCRGLLCAGGR
jgi:hypothetical protein